MVGTRLGIARNNLVGVDVVPDDIDGTAERALHGGGNMGLVAAADNPFSGRTP